MNEKTTVAGIPMSEIPEKANAVNNDVADNAKIENTNAETKRFSNFLKAFAS